MKMSLQIPDSTFLYGKMLFDGVGIRVDIEESAKYFKKGAELGNIESSLE